jgi:NAD(P)-dependent dehydrogenase (short-subunit alcohol dehydrogenase family)
VPRREPIQLRGATALVTGAGSGIGRATALALAGRGARVLCADLDGEKAALTASSCGGGASAHRVDVADRAAMLQLADDVGPVDVLVNNAGVGMSARFLDTTLDDWDWIVGINLMGVVHGCKAFGPGMVERGRGHVVNMSSGLGYTPRATEPGYVTTKAAVLQLSRCLRADWRAHGVGVSAVCPGVIDTPIIHHTRFRGDRADPKVVARTKKLFAKRGHPPELVAEGVLRAIDRDTAVAPVGFESHLGWYASRVLPTKLTDLMARSGL